MSASNEDRIRVLHLQRSPRPAQFSVERLFEDVRSALPCDIDVSLRVCAQENRGLFPRLRDAVAASVARRPVTHVLGDAHYLAWFLPRKGTVLTVLDCVNLRRLTGVRRWLYWVAWYWWPLRRCEAVTVISEFSKLELMSWSKIPPERIVVIPPPLSPEFTGLIDVPPLDARPRPHRILQVGTKGNKNLERVIEAATGLDATLVIVGGVDAALRERMHHLRVRHEILTALSRPELLNEYERASALCFVSTYEGFGLPIIEAQATGCPVLTSTVCSMPEVAGGAALTVDPYDVQQIHEGLSTLLRGGLIVDRLIAQGKANVARFNVVDVAARYSYIYREVGRRVGTSAYSTRACRP